jgi:hypothetical protein
MRVRLSEFVSGLAAYWREALLILVSITVTYLMLEVGYRAYHYWTLPGRLLQLVAAQLPANYDQPSEASPNPQYLPDQHTGYVYAPNFQGKRGAPWHSHWRTNSHGHVSKFEYPRQKPRGEYRIAVVGDSMTANITNNVRWTEVLEEDLNASSKWRTRIDDKVTRVINFGVDGMGMVQFGAMVRHHVMGFEPDLIIVNFIADDILRRLRYFSVIPGSDGRVESVRSYVKKNFLEEINWFGVCPELLTATVGRLWGKRCALPLDPHEIVSAGPAFHFASRKDAINNSAAAVEGIMSLFHNTIFLQMPMFHELGENRPLPQWRGLVDDLRRAVPRSNIVSMLPQMDARLEGKRLRDRPDLAGMRFRQLLALPEHQKPELHRWFFIGDAHYTDYGTTIYAQAVARYLIETAPDGLVRSPFQGNAPK